MSGPAVAFPGERGQSAQDQTAARFAEQDRERSRWLDEQIALEDALTGGKGGCPRGETLCSEGCGVHIGINNRSGRCTACQRRLRRRAPKGTP